MPNNSNPEQGAVILAAQGTNISTGVTCHAIRGQVTTQGMDAVAGAENEFVLTNRFITPGSIVVGNLVTASAGTPILGFSKLAAGSCTVTLTNTHSANALNAVGTINFLVL